MFQTKFVQKIKTNILCSVTIFYEYRAIYEIMWKKNIIERGRPQMTAWRMNNACLIPKVANTHSEHVLIIAFPLQQCLRERDRMLIYTYTACLGIISYALRQLQNHFHQFCNRCTLLLNLLHIFL